MQIKRIPKRIFGKLSQYIHVTGDISIITGANAPFYESMRDNLLTSVMRYEPKARLIIWDLGLTDEQRKELKIFLDQHNGKVDIYTYPEDTLPPHYAMDRWNYAFKSYCIFHSLPLIETKYAMWLDAGCGLRGPLNAEKNILYMYGYYSPYSSTTIGELTHPTTMDNMLDWKIQNAGKRMLSGGVQGWNMDDKRVIAMLDEWYNLCRIEDNIAPKGATLQNHRYDQSLLSLVYYGRHNQVPYFAQNMYNIGIHLNK